jgi:hypothetical protein
MAGGTACAVCTPISCCYPGILHIYALINLKRVPLFTWRGLAAAARSSPAPTDLCSVSLRLSVRAITAALLLHAVLLLAVLLLRSHFMHAAPSPSAHLPIRLYTSRAYIEVASPAAMQHRARCNPLRTQIAGIVSVGCLELLQEVALGALSLRRRHYRLLPLLLQLICCCAPSPSTRQASPYHHAMMGPPATSR